MGVLFLRPRVRRPVSIVPVLAIIYGPSVLLVLSMVVEEGWRMCVTNLYRRRLRPPPSSLQAHTTSTHSNYIPPSYTLHTVGTFHHCQQRDIQ